MSHPSVLRCSKRSNCRTHSVNHPFSSHMPIRPSTVRKRRRSSASKVPSLSQIARSPRLASSRQEGHQRHQRTRHVRASSDVTHSPLPSSSPSPLHLVVRLPADLRATSLVAFLTPRRLSLVTHAVSPFPPVHMVTRTAGAASGPCKSHAGPGRAHSPFLCPTFACAGYLTPHSRLRHISCSRKVETLSSTPRLVFIVDRLLDPRGWYHLISHLSPFLPPSLIHSALALIGTNSFLIVLFTDPHC